MVEVKSYFRKSRNKKEMSANNRKAALARWGKLQMLKYAKSHDAPEYVIEEIKQGGYKNLKEVKDFLGD